MSSNTLDKNTRELIPFAGVPSAKLNILEDKANSALNNEADTYSSSKAYAVGDVVINNNQLYKCTTACSAGSWATNQNCFTVTTLGAYTSQLNSDVSDAASVASSAASTANTASSVASRADDMIWKSTDQYSTSKAYSVGDYVIYNNTLYKCTTACSAGSWSTNSSNFTSTTLSTAVTELNSADSKEEAID